jgi:hypothetical protein
VIIIKKRYENEKEMNLSNEKYQCDLVVSCDDDGEERREYNIERENRGESQRGSSYKRSLFNFQFFGFFH